MNEQQIFGLFSPNYKESREKFLTAARQRGLPVDSFTLDMEGKDGEALATDVVVDGPRDASKLLIVISAVHGAEGYPGSAIQTGLLQLGDPASLGADADTALLHIHAVNPWGYSHTRRVTQENIDLNRNFMDFGKPLPVNLGYREIHDLLLPPQWPPSEESEARLQAFREREGERGFQRAVSLGQYEFTDGLHFGGTAPAWSNLTFRQILQRYAARARHIASVDIHTGLGPFGHGEKIFACPNDDVVFARATDWWGQLTSVQTGTSTSIPMTGPIQFGLYDECPEATKTNICLEFGTLPLGEVITAMRADHWLHRYGSQDCAKIAAIKQALKGAFSPDSPEWKTAIWNQGFEACVAALRGLSRMETH